MKYQEITKNEFSDKIGCVKIGGQTVQLCDHIQIVDGRYHVSALFTNEEDAQTLNEMGAPTKKMYNGTKIAYLNEQLLSKAKPIYKDGMTENLIERLISAMNTLNKQRMVAA